MNTTVCIWLIFAIAGQAKIVQASSALISRHCNWSQWYERRAVVLAFISHPLLAFQRHGLIRGQVTATLYGPSPDTNYPILMQTGLDTTLTALWPILQTHVHMQPQQLQMRTLIITASDSMYCKMSLSAYKIIFRYQFTKELPAKHSLGQRFENQTCTKN